MKPEKMSLTKFDILIGSSKLPSVTTLTAYLDCEKAINDRSDILKANDHQLVDHADQSMKIILNWE